MQSLREAEACVYIWEIARCLRLIKRVWDSQMSELGLTLD
jgi:hypothetical protein